MAIKGDFLGFKFGGIHSSDLGIIRVSDGNRYETTVLPEIADISIDVPGMDGEYYFGSRFGKKSIEISIAFDSLTEEQIRKIRRIFSTKEIQSLIFDECPYKQYLAKLENPIELSYVCFDEAIPTKAFDSMGIKERDIYGYSSTTQRIYKGEGRIQFVCYFPFAKSNFKILPETEGIDGYENLNDWAASSGILSQEIYNSLQIDKYNNGEIKIYNAGDIDTGFRLFCPFPCNDQLILTYTPILLQNSDISQLVINPCEVKGNDEGILINTDTELIQGVIDLEVTQDGNVTYTTTGNLYNEYIDSGFFFKLKPNIDVNDGSFIEIVGGNEGIQIFYDYLYF